MFQKRKWIDELEVSCEDKLFKLNGIDWKLFSELYWLILLSFLIWLPTLIMIVCYCLIFRKLKMAQRFGPAAGGQDEYFEQKVPHMDFVQF